MRHRSSWSGGLTGAVLLLSGCCKTDLAKVLQDYGYAEVRPPSTLAPPGTVIGLDQGSLTPIVVCTREEALGSSVTVQTSDSKSSDLARKTEGSFTLNADYLKQIKVDAKYESVEDVKLTLRNTKVLSISLAHAIDRAKDRTPGCTSAIKRMRAAGRSVSMIYGVLQADVSYTIAFSSKATLDASAKAEILKGLAAQFGASTSTSGTSSITGEALFWGVADDALMLEDSPAAIKTMVAKVVLDPSTQKPLQLASLLPSQEGKPVTFVKATREQRDLDVQIADGTVRNASGGKLDANYLKDGWRVVKVYDLKVGDRVGVVVERDPETRANCGVLDVLIHQNGAVRGVVGATSTPGAQATLNDWLGAGWKEVASTQFGTPPIGDRLVYAVCK